jgi:predicted dehydrogenase
MWSRRLLDISLRVTGETGSVHVLNFVAPQLYHRLTVRTADGRVRERVAGKATYTYQLEAFQKSIVDGAPVLTGATDAVRTMELIDDAYRAAGMRPRQPTPVAG